MKHLERLLVKHDSEATIKIDFHHLNNRVRCYAHIINLCAARVIASVSRPKGSGSGDAALSYDDSDYGDDDDVDDHVDHDNLKDDVDDLELADRFDVEGDIPPGAWSAGVKRDPIKRARNLIRFLCSSDQRKLGFQKCIIDAVGARRMDRPVEPKEYGRTARPKSPKKPRLVTLPRQRRQRSLLEELIAAGYDPTQPIPGSFPSVEDLTPPSSLSSEQSEPSPSHSGPEEANSEEEVDLILSSNSAPQPARQGATTRSRARLLAQQTEAQPAEETETNPQITRQLPGEAEEEANPQPGPSNQQRAQSAPPQQSNPTPIQPVPPVPSQSAPAPPTALRPPPAGIHAPPPVNVRRMPLADLPRRGERGVPSFDGEQPEELGRYFAEVEALFVRHTVTTDQDKKTGTLKYLTTAATERVFRTSDALTDAAKTYDEYKAEIYKLYPGSSDDIHTILHLDTLVGQRARIGIISELELGDYYRQFKVISKYLISKNRMSQAEQTRAFMRGLQPEMEQQVKQRLQLKFPDHNQQDPYNPDELYDAASYVIQGRTPATISGPTATGATASTSAEIKTEIQSAMASAIATMGEMFKSALESQSPGDRARSTGNTRQTEQSTKCNFCGVPGHFVRECEIVAEYMRLGKCKRSVEGKIVLPSGAFLPRGITGTWLRDRIDEYHKQNPGQVGAAQMLLEMSGPTTVAEPTTTKTVRFAEECPEPGQAGVYAFRRGFVPRIGGRPRARSDGPPTARIQEIDEEREPSPHRRDPPPHLEKSLPQAAETVTRDHPFARKTAQVPTTTNVTEPIATTNTTSERRNERAYTSNAAIYDEKTASQIYDRMMDTEVTVTQRELLSLAPELRSQVSEVTTKRRIARVNAQESTEEVAEPKPKRSTESHMPAAFSAARRAPPANATIIADPYEALLKARPAEGDGSQETMEVATESNALRAILPVVDGSEKVEAILDPGCQIVAMSEEVCNALAIPYDPSIRLNMISANGGVDQSLGLARNVPFHVGEITLYLQVHILRSPAYDILLGRPFDILTQSVVRNYRNEDQTITILDPNTGKTATVPTIPRGSNRFAERRKVQTNGQSQPHVADF
ncbi:hypothetical protein EDB84DRAFT_1564013 [Lactarius hengduanensis]|nr:hypothetical protein EDB84DRAFT_1564013 [Lactarius hengduanensis]